MMMKRKTLYIILSVIFWLCVWELAAKAVKLNFVFPAFHETVVALFRLAKTSAYWLAVLASLGRILLGLVFGVLAGTFLGAVCAKSKTAEILISPLITVIKSTPVASFILLLWVIIGRSTVPGAISALMVTPILYQTVYSSILSLDPKKSEVLHIYKVPILTKFRIFIFPSIFKDAVPALISASGFAWKAGIAAEIIAYTKNSIGGAICDAKAFFEGPAMYAWTLTVILLSLLIELLIKTLGKKAVTYVSSRA